MSGLEEMIAGLRSLERLPERTAEIAAEELGASLKQTAGSGQSPDGAAWAPKKDGGRAMAGAAKAIDAKALGPVVRVKLTGPEVFHHFSKKKGEPRRQVIPDAGAGIPAVVQDILDKSSARAFEELAGGKGGVR